MAAMHLLQVHAVHPADEMQNLAAGELIVQKRLIGHIADQGGRFARVGDDVVAADANRAAAGANQADQHFDGRRFAGAVVAEQGVELAGRHAQIQILDRDFVAVRSVNLLKFNHRDSERGAAIVATESISSSLSASSSISRFDAPLEPQFRVHQVNILPKHRAVVGHPNHCPQRIIGRHAGRRQAAVFDFSRVHSLAAMVDEPLFRRLPPA